MQMCLRTTGHVGISRLLDSGCRCEQVELEIFCRFKRYGGFPKLGVPSLGVLFKGYSTLV